MTSTNGLFLNRKHFARACSAIQARFQRGFFDQEGVEKLGVAQPQRAAVFDVNDTASGIMARAAVMPLPRPLSRLLAWQPALLLRVLRPTPWLLSLTPM